VEQLPEEGDSACSVWQDVVPAGDVILVQFQFPMIHYMKPLLGQVRVPATTDSPVLCCRGLKGTCPLNSSQYVLLETRE